MLWNSYREIIYKYLSLQESSSDYVASKDTTLESRILTSKFIFRSRETLISDKKSCIYNNILYPHTGCDLPCLGMDLMGFSEKRVVIVFDFQHPTSHYDFDDPLVRGYMGHYAGNTKDGIKFFEPGNHFSKYIFVRKCTAEHVNDYLEDFRAYLNTYKMLLLAYKPTGEDYSVYSDFDKYMRELDPVEGYLAHKFNKEFAKEYVENFLFPVSLNT